MGITIHVEGYTPLPEVIFPFADGTKETLLWDEEAWTWYWLKPDGTRQKLRGVTKTVHVMSKGDALANWMKRVCLEKLRALLVERHLGPDNALQLFVTELDDAIIESKKTDEKALVDAGTVGHRAHHHIEAWIKSVLTKDTEKQEELTTHLPVSPDDPSDERAANCVLACFTWIADHNVRFEFTERPVFSRKYGYAGTCDGGALVDSCSDPRCCEKPFKDMRSIIDHKTSNATVPYVEYVYQVCSYQGALEEQTGQRWEDRWINLYDKITGKFRAYRFAGREQFKDGFVGFVRCLDLTDSVERTKADLDERRDARKAVELDARRAAREQAHRLACSKSVEYKGVRLSKCFSDGTQCEACAKIYKVRKEKA